MSRDFLNIVQEMLYCKPNNFPNALVCAECNERIARQACYECDIPFCDRCFLNLHSGDSGMAFHYSCQINYKAMDALSFMCGHCEVRPAVTYCLDCDDAFCIACKEEEHTKGARAFHASFIAVDSEKNSFLIQSDQVAATAAAAAAAANSSSSSTADQTMAYLVQIRETLKSTTRTMTGEDKNWKTTVRLNWEQSDEAIRIQNETAEKERINILLKEHKEKVQVIFNAFDLDQNGTIDEDEMVTVFRTVICAPLSKKEIKIMYKELDADGNGEIDFNEFHYWYTGMFRLPRCVSRLIPGCSLLSSLSLFFSFYFRSQLISLTQINLTLREEN